MDKNLHDIDKLFHDAIEPLEDSPGRQVWENIGNALDKNETVQYRKKTIALKRLSAALLLLLLGFGVYHYITLKNMRAGQKDSPTAANLPPVKKSGDAASTKAADNTSLPQQVPGNNPGNENTNANTGASVFTAAPTAIPPIIKNTEQAGDDEPAKERKTAAGNNKQSWQHIYRDNKTSITVTTPAPDITNDNEPSQITAIYTAGLLALPSLPAEKIVAAPVNHNSIFTNKINLSLPAAGRAATAKVKPVTGRRFSAGIFFAPGFTANSLHDDEEHRRGGPDDRHKIEDRESSTKTTTAGINFSYLLGRYLSVRAGIGYYSSVNKTGEAKIFAERDNSGVVKYRHNSSSGFCYILPEFSSSPAVGDSLKTTGGFNRLKYIELPLTLHYAFTKGRFGLNPGIGFSVNILTGATSANTVQNTVSKTTITSNMEGLNKTNVNLLVIPELQYRVGKKLYASLSPYLKYALKPVNTGTVVNTYPLNAGLGLGMIYKF
jgi:hypothetical protein